MPGHLSSTEEYHRRVAGMPSPLSRFRQVYLLLRMSLNVCGVYAAILPERIAEITCLRLWANECHVGAHRL
jgi:hypothetical protein